MAVFGAPVAHEDDAERAVRAALSMQRAVRRVLDDERGGGAPLGLRVGLNTGEVVAGVQAAHRVHGHRRHGEHRRPAGRRRRGRRGLRRRAHRRGDPARRLLAAAAAAAAQGQARAGRGVRAARPARRAGHPVRAGRRGAVRRPGDRAGPGRRPARRGRSTAASPGCWCSPPRPGIGKTRFAAEVERFAAGYDVGAGPVRRAHRRPGAARCAAPRSASAAGSRRWPTWSAPPSACPTDAATAVTRAVVEERLRRLAPAARARAPATRRRLRHRPLLALLGYARAAGRPGRPGRGAELAAGRRGAGRRGDPGRGRRAAQRAGRRGAAGGHRRRPARRHRRRPSTRSARRCHRLDRARCWCCCSAGPSWSARPAR